MVKIQVELCTGKDWPEKIGWYESAVIPRIGDEFWYDTHLEPGGVACVYLAHKVVAVRHEVDMVAREPEEITVFIQKAESTTELGESIGSLDAKETKVEDVAKKRPDGGGIEELRAMLGQ